MIIFNSCGDQVFHSDDGQNEWKGTHKGRRYLLLYSGIPNDHKRWLRILAEIIIIKYYLQKLNLPQLNIKKALYILIYRALFFLCVLCLNYIIVSMVVTISIQSFACKENPSLVWHLLRCNHITAEYGFSSNMVS